jgi:hypothetical protein
MKVQKQQFDAVLKQLLQAPPMKMSEIVPTSKRGRPRKAQAVPARKPSR